jgi:hypothetical protein
MEPKLEYDASFNQATLVAHPDAWYVWMKRPSSEPAVLHIEERNSVGDVIGDWKLDDQEAVIAYFEQRLVEVGYFVTREQLSEPRDHIAAWALAPGQN